MRRRRRSLFKGVTNLIFAAVFSFSIAGTVKARMASGNDLMQHCSTAPDGFCAGYIGGVIDTSHSLFCIPPEITKRQLINITIMYLRDHPKTMAMYAPNLVVAATRTAFPCNDGR